MLRNLGQICGMLRKTYEEEEEAYADVRAFGAPSECLKDVRNGYGARRVEMVEDFEKSTGYTADELLDEIDNRVGRSWLNRHGDFCEAFVMLIEKREEEEFERQRRKRWNRSRLPDVSMRYYF